jgi:hypothetical protein
MRYPASEKLEIIRTVETSPLPVRRTLVQIGIPKSTFYAWLDRQDAGGFAALEDRKPRPERVWNRISDDVRPLGHAMCGGVRHTASSTTMASTRPSIHQPATSPNP